MHLGIEIRSFKINTRKIFLASVAVENTFSPKIGQYNFMTKVKF